MKISFLDFEQQIADLSGKIEALRSASGEGAADISEEKRTEARAIFALAIAGLYYIVLHKDRAPFGGFDINVAEDRAEIEKALEKIGEIIANY